MILRRAHTRSAGRYFVLPGLVALLTVLLVPAQAGAVGTTLGLPEIAPPATEQSDQPAPPSSQKRVIDNVHSDTVSAYLDDGRLVLETKSDVDGEIGKRFRASEMLFHVSDRAATAVPDLPAYAFLGAPGTPIWLAPQVQNHDIIWPGFSTEDPNLRGQVAGDRLAIRLIEADGPGNVEVFLQDGPVVERLFSGSESLPDWHLNVPQHAHANWSFSAAGTYTLTFEMSGTIAGEEQSARNTYTFVVGELADHTRVTTTELTAPTASVDVGTPVPLVSRVTPVDAVGAVQIVDADTGAVLGHTPVRAGVASFQAHGLVPGEHRLRAEFVPTWSTDFRPAQSPPVAITVSGEVAPKPDYDDTTPVPEADLIAHTPGTQVVASQSTIHPGGAATVKLTDDGHAGTWVSVWIPGLTPEWQGWTQADLRGNVSIALPASIPIGTHRFIVKHVDGSLIGWDRFTVTARPDSGGPGPAPGPAPEPTPEPTPPAPAQCEPGIVLDHGHIDAFNVSAANDQAVLGLLEDVTGHRVIRDIETVLLRVTEQALANIPAGTPGAPGGYVLPLTQDPALIWPGWNTNRTSTSGYTDVSIAITEVQGPGQVFLYTQGAFGDWKPILTNGSYQLPGTIREPKPAHTHAQWVFSQKGIYELTAHAVLVNPSTGRTITTTAHTLVIQVGDVPLGDTFCRVTPSASSDAVTVNTAVDRALAVAAAEEQARAAAEEQKRALEREQRLAAAEESARQGQEQRIGDGSPQETNTTEQTALLIGIAVGTVLVIVGIIGATLRHVRRLGAGPPQTRQGSGVG